MTICTRKSLLALFAAFCLMLTVSVAAPVRVFAGHPTNIIQKHPTLTGIAAGVATHHMLKVSAANKKAHGQKLNFAERHPTLSGFAVGLTTHHIIKKTTPH